jgi:diguanylate cyclase (GGDEF)-like protein
MTKAIGHFIRSRLFMVWACLLYVLSCAGIFQGFRDLQGRPLSILQLALAVLIVLSAIAALFKFSTASNKSFQAFELFAFLILVVDIFVGLTGGIRSLLLPLQFFLVILAAGVLGRLPAVIVAAATALLQAFHAGLASPPAFFRSPEFLPVVSFSAAAVLLALLTQFLQSMERRRADRALGELKRLRFGLDQLGGRAEGEGNHFERVTTEGVLYKKVDSAMELERMVENLLRLIHKTLVVHTAVIFRYDRGSETLQIKNWFSLDETMTLEVKIRPGEGPVGWVAKHRKPLNLSSKGKVVKNLGYYPSRNVIRSFLAVPILHHSQLEGVLAADSMEPEYFDKEDERLLSDYARHIVQLTENVRMLHKQGEETVELKALYEGSRLIGRKIELAEVVDDLLDLSEQIVESDFSAVVMLTEDLRHYTIQKCRGLEREADGERFPNDGSSWVSWLMRNRDEALLLTSLKSERMKMPILFPGDSIGKGAGSFVGIPLKIKDRPLGALCLVRVEKESLSSHHSRLLSILCNQASYVVDNARMYKKMEELAITDGLTGLFNHRHFQEMLDRELTRAERKGAEVSLILLDIDFFKKLNDTHGHPAGDSVLRGVSGIIRSETRQIDIAARYGGEEFAVVLPDTGSRETMKIAERVRAAVEEARIPHEKRVLETTISVGFSCYPTEATTKQDLIHKADQALYAAKQGGRNRICSFAESRKLLDTR